MRYPKLKYTFNLIVIKISWWGLDKTILKLTQKKKCARTAKEIVKSKGDDGHFFLPYITK